MSMIKSELEHESRAETTISNDYYDWSADHMIVILICWQGSTAVLTLQMFYL